MDPSVQLLAAQMMNEVCNLLPACLSSCSPALSWALLCRHARAHTSHTKHNNSTDETGRCDHRSPPPSACVGVSGRGGDRLWWEPELYFGCRVQRSWDESWQKLSLAAGVSASVNLKTFTWKLRMLEKNPQKNSSAHQTVNATLPVVDVKRNPFIPIERLKLWLGDKSNPRISGTQYNFAAAPLT